MGGTEVKLSSTLSGPECVRACVVRKMTDSDINGVTVLQSGRGGCWCEKNMEKVSTSDKIYKTCLLKPGMISV